MEPAHAVGDPPHFEAAMIGKNEELETLLRELDCEIRLREATLLGHGRATSIATDQLHQMRSIRRCVIEILLNRRIEASKPVVDLARWLNGNGTLPRKSLGAATIPPAVA
jgi:hypothetical protein